MAKKLIVILILIIAIILVFSGIILTFSNNTPTTKVQEEKKTISEELYEKLSVQLKIEGYTLEYVKHEGDIYYFNQIDEKGNVGYEVTYNEKTEEIATIDKNTISEGYEEIK